MYFVVFDHFRSLQQSDMGVNSLIFTMTSKAPAIVDADRCTVFLVDEKSGSIWYGVAPGPQVTTAVDHDVVMHLFVFINVGPSREKSTFESHSRSLVLPLRWPKRAPASTSLTPTPMNALTKRSNLLMQYARRVLEECF